MNYNCRFYDFLKFALKHTLETAHMYADEAKKCNHKEKKIFLYYLAGKKRMQYVQIDLLAQHKETITEFNTMTFDNLKVHQHNFASLSISQIHDFAKAKAEKDLSLFLYLLTLEEDRETKKLLLSLSKLSKEFLRDISSGYSQFRSQKGPYYPQHSFIATLQFQREMVKKVPKAEICRAPN